VVQVYTLHYGKISLLVHGVKKKKSRNKSALFEPLTILELNGNFKDTAKLIRPSEVKLHIPFISIQSSVSKRLVVLFLADVLHKCVREPNPEQEMYVFIENSLKLLEYSDQNISNFHIVFLLQLSRYLGFYPRVSEGHYFSMLEGSFLNSVPESNLYLQGLEKDLFLQVLGIKIDNLSQLNLNSEQRKMALSFVLQYYQVHVSGFGEIKSHLILESIFS
jgi:DNA repair protein RecO (recombination protein O)